MAVDVRIIFSADGKQAERVVSQLGQQFRQTTSQVENTQKELQSVQKDIDAFIDKVESIDTKALDGIPLSLSEMTFALEHGIAGVTKLDVALKKLGESSTEVTAAMVSQFSQLGGDIGTLATKIDQFDIKGLASGNPVSIATLPFQLYNAFTFDQRQLEKTRPERHQRNLDLYLQGEFGIPPDLLENVRGRIAAAQSNVTEANFLSAADSQHLNALIQGLNPVIGKTSLLELDEFPERLVETITGFTDGILSNLALDLRNAEQGLANAQQFDSIDSEQAFQEYIKAVRNFYETQISVIYLIRKTTGNLSYGDPEGLGQDLQNLLNQARIQNAADRPPSLGSRQQTARDNIRRSAERRASDESLRLMYGPDFDPTVVVPYSGDVDEAVAGLSDLDISNLHRQADAAIAAFTDAVNTPARTVASINAAFQTLEPQLRDLYDGLFQQIAGADGVINTDAEQIALNELGSFQEFTARHADIRDAATDAVNQARQYLDTLNTEIATRNVIGAFQDTVQLPGATVESITQEWENTVAPQLHALYDTLFQQIAGADGFINTTAEQIEYAKLGSREDFITRYENDILMPSIQEMENIATRIASLQQDRELETTLQRFAEAVLAPGQTISGLTEWWETHMTPVLQETYDLLREQIIGADGEISDAELAELMQAGLDISFQDWASDYRENILHPGIEKLAQFTERIADIERDRHITELWNRFDEALQAPGATVAGVTQWWNENVEPVLLQTYQTLRERIIGDDGEISPAEAAALAEAGLDQSFTDWASQYRADIFDPGIQRLSNTQTAIATALQNIEQDNILEGFRAAAIAPGATVAGVTQWWNENVEPVLLQTYQTLRSEIIGEDGLISPTERLTLINRGLNAPFEDWARRFENDILQPAIENIDAGIDDLRTTELQATVDTILDDFKAAADAPGATIAALTEQWNTTVAPALQALYEDMYSQIAGDDGIINTTQEQAQLLRLGTPDAFIADRFNTIFKPIIENIDAGISDLRTTQLQATVDTILDDFKAAADAPGATIAALTEQWNTTVAPALQALYEDMYSQIAGDDGIINTTREQAQLLRLGTPDAFLADRFNNIFSPMVESLQSRNIRSTQDLGINRINRAEFELSRAGDEGEWTRQRDELIAAINAYYDAEEERIASLTLSESELQNLREDNQLAREKALADAQNATNHFAEVRIASEIRLQDEIADLRDSAMDAETDRQERLVELHEHTAEEIEDIQRRANRSKEDSRIDYSREIENLHTDVQRELESLFAGRDNFQQITGAVLSGLSENVTGLDISDSDIQKLLDIQTELNADRDDAAKNLRQDYEDIERQEERQIEDEMLTEQRNIVDLNKESNQRLDAIQAELEKLVGYAAEGSEGLAKPNPNPELLSVLSSLGIAIGEVATDAAPGTPALATIAETASPELFHFDQTDAIAYRLAHQSGLAQPRRAPNYLPTPDQLRNARDVGREVIAGYTDGVQQSSRSGNIPEKARREDIHATLQIQFPDGTIQELRNQMVRLQLQDRSL